MSIERWNNKNKNSLNHQNQNHTILKEGVSQTLISDFEFKIFGSKTQFNLHAQLTSNID